MRVVAGLVSLIALTSTITASSTQANLSAVATTVSPAGGTGVYSYSATLRKPTGSSSSVTGGTTATPSFTPDKAGLYTLVVTVTSGAQSIEVTRTQEVRSMLSIALTASSSQSALTAISTVATPTGGLDTITYQHTLTRPTASSATLSGDTTTTSSVTPDKAGSYTIVVVATDAAGQTARAERVVEVVSTLSVSIAAISDQAGATGTISCDSTVSNALGSLTYSWVGEKPDGTAISFSDATAADPTITLSAADKPGNYSITVTVTDSARAQTTTATATFRVGTAQGWVQGYAHDYTADGNETISASPWGAWTVLNVANASTFAIVAGTGLRIIASTGTLSAAARTQPAISQAITGLASMYAAGRRVGVHLQIGTGSAVGSSQRKVGAVFEDTTTPIGDSGSTERGGGVVWRNNAGTIQVAAIMAGLSSGTGFVQAGKPTTETAPRVLAFERCDWGFRVGHSTNTAAYGDPAHASWVWAERLGVDYASNADKLVPATDLLTIFAAADAGGAGAQIDLEKLWVGVQW